MTNVPIVFGAPYSTYTRTVLLALEEKGVAYGFRLVDFLKGDAKLPEYLARHPFGKVPAFEHGSLRLYEAGAITRYVDEAFGGPRLQPPDITSRARMMQAIGIIESYIYPSVVGAIVIQRLVNPALGKKPDEQTIERSIPRARKSLGVLETFLEGSTFLTGDAVSLADLYLVPMFDYLMQTPEGAPVTDDLPLLLRWWKDIGERPSVDKTHATLP